MIAIKPTLIEGATAVSIEYKAKNESVVRVNFYDAGKHRVASTLINIPSDKELNEENILAEAKVEAVEKKAAKKQPDTTISNKE